MYELKNSDIHNEVGTRRGCYWIYKNLGGSDAWIVEKKREPKYMKIRYCFGFRYIVPNAD